MDSVLRVNRFLMWYLQKLVADIPDERMAEQPLPGVNHPAWILGHLAWSTDRCRLLLGLEPELPAEWTPMFGFGSQPTSARGDYPARDELIRAVEQGFERLRDQIASATPEQLAQPSPNSRTNEFLPTVQDGLVLLLTGHLNSHLGQFSMWRRMVGMPNVF
jgi:DinB superfamily